MDPKVKKSRLSTTGGEESDAATSAASLVKEEKVPRSSSSASPSNRSISPQEEPTVSGRDHSSRPEEPDKQIRTSARLKYPQGKKKVKVDWTPELHKKFVQAVEKLGIDKAVPSRILELMGIDCLTRHNVASHLQKYRSHRKHMLAREAEALSWTRRRQIRGSASNPRTGKRDTNAYGSTTTTTGFPHHHNNSRPLHVWGHPPHPYADQSLMYTWAANQPRDPTLWYWHQNVPAQGLPCYSPYMPPARPATPVVPGIIANPSVYRVGVPFLPNGQTLSRQPYDELQSKERIDAVIGDVLSKPWLPLPLGLRAPSFDTVMVELQRQGISKVPPPSFA